MGMNLQIKLRRIDILAILSLPNYECGTSIYLLFNIFHQNFVAFLTQILYIFC